MRIHLLRSLDVEPKTRHITNGLLEQQREKQQDALILSFARLKQVLCPANHRDYLVVIAHLPVTVTQ